MRCGTQTIGPPFSLSLTGASPDIMRLVFLPLLALLSSAAKAMSLEPYNLSLTDNSPTITYLPYRSGPSDSGWNVTFSQSPAWLKTADVIGQGTSRHYTTAAGATASVGWVGTAVYIFGSAGAGSTRLTVDGSENGVTSPQGTIGVLEGLDYGWHNLTLEVTGTGGVNITGVTLTLGLGDEG